MAAITDVVTVIRGCTYDSNKVLTEATAATLAAGINDACDAVSDLAFSSIELSCRRMDNVPGS